MELVQREIFVQLSDFSLRGGPSEDQKTFFPNQFERGCFNDIKLIALTIENVKLKS